MCWGSSISKKDTFRQDKLIGWAFYVVGMKLDFLVTVAEERTLNKLLVIMDDATHSLYTVSAYRSLFCLFLYFREGGGSGGRHGWGGQDEGEIEH